MLNFYISFWFRFVLLPVFVWFVWRVSNADTERHVERISFELYLLTVLLAFEEDACVKDDDFLRI